MGNAVSYHDYRKLLNALYSSVSLNTAAILNEIATIKYFLITNSILIDA